MKKKRMAGPEKFLKANLRLAAQALRALPKEERDISAVTVSLSGPAADQIRWELRDLRRRILELAREDARHDRIYQVNLQFFPISR